MIVDKQEYETKLGALVGDKNTYEPLKKDPTEKYRTQLIKILLKWKNDNTIPEYLYKQYLTWYRPG